MARSIVRTNRVRQIACIALASTAACVAMPGIAWADCTASGTAVTCSGTSSAYTYSGTSAAQVTVNSGATVTAPIIVSVSGSTLANAGSISNTGSYYAVQYGSNATITNTGTISSTGTTADVAGAISVGANSTVTNSGTLTAYSGTDAVVFNGVNGRYIQTSSATGATSGNIDFGTNTGSDRAYFENDDSTYGLTSVVYAKGNIDLVNNGIWTGTLSQTKVEDDSTVTFTNGSAGTFTGVLATQDTTTLVNNGTMYLYSGSGIGTYYTTSGGTSTVTNNGTLWIGTEAAPTKLSVYGSYTQSSTGELDIPISSTSTATAAAGTTYSQLYTTGAVSLAGTIRLQVAAGFYATGSTYSVIDAAGGITTSGTVTTAGGDLLFVKFTPYTGTYTGTTFNGSLTNQQSVDYTCTTGICSNSLTTEQTYTYVATHLLYSSVMAVNGANANQISVATGLDKLITTASNDTSSDAATLLGEVDLLDAAGAKTFLDSLSPEGYLAYAQALRDQANLFSRMVDLRMYDQNSNHPEDGWWLNMTGQGSFSSTASTAGGYRTRDQLFGITGGYDFSGPRHVWGLALHASWDKLHYAPATLSGTNRDFAVALYGAQYFGKLRVSGQLAYNLGHLSANKTLIIGSYTRTASASTGENLFKAKGDIGYDIKLGKWKVEPFVGIDFMKGKINGFTETGASSADLTVSGINADRTDLLAGVYLTKAVGKFRPYVRALYRNALGNRGTDVITAYMNGQTDSTFTVTGLTPAKNEVDANVGVNWVFDDAGSLFVGYQGTIRSDYQAHGINLGIRLEF